MRTKSSHWLCGVAAALLGVSGFVDSVRADNPPWPPRVLVIAGDSDAAEEGSDTAIFLVVRTGSADAPLTVHYALGGDAVNGMDYDSLTGEVTIPTGDYFAPITVTPVDES